MVLLVIMLSAESAAVLALAAAAGDLADGWGIYLAILPLLAAACQPEPGKCRFRAYSAKTGFLKCPQARFDQGGRWSHPGCFGFIWIAATIVIRFPGHCCLGQRCHFANYLAELFARYLA